MMSRELEILAESHSYITPLKYLSGRIVEYDIAAANITMLRKYNKISEEYYNYLKNLPKDVREKEIGLIIKSDKSYYDCINRGIVEAKKMLFDANNLDMYRIVRIANDAVYIDQSYDLIHTTFEGNIQFKQKSISHAMLKIDSLYTKLIFFYCEDKNGIDLVTKGINESSQALHADYMLSMIATCINILQHAYSEDALKFITDFYKQYVQLKLPKEFYRELNSNSMYKHRYSSFYLTSIPDIHDIDINYNLGIIREIYTIIYEEYNKMRGFRI